MGGLIHPSGEEDQMNGAGDPRRTGAGILAAALTGLATLLAACSGSGSSPALAGTTAFQKELAYSQCMRSHGEPGFPDPQPNGALLINGPKDHLNGALMNSANKACQHLLPKQRPMTAAQQRQFLDQALKFVACMRSHGLPDMPDPVMQGGGVNQQLPRGTNPSSPVFQSAQRACQKLLPVGPP
jgi:hypothetical protein